MSLSPTVTPSFSSSQRRCHLLLMFFLPGHAVTLEELSQINGVDRQFAWQDMMEVGREIQRCHHLEMKEDAAGAWRLYGKELDKRLCLLHWLRRTLHVSPEFVMRYFAPALRQTLRARRCEKALYDEHNLRTLILYCARQLSREFSPRDCQFLQLCLQYCLCASEQVNFTEHQQSWLRTKPEWKSGDTIFYHWHKRCVPPPASSEGAFITLLFSLIHVPVIEQITSESERQLSQAIQALIARFQQLSGMHFSDESRLLAQLYTHLVQAVDRTLFSVEPGDALAEEMLRLYPRLLRTTREALAPFEAEFAIRFSAEELSLIGVIFGAGLMQKSALQEKQVLLLTDKDASLEREIEQQLRELTLLPLNISYLDVATWQREGTPEGIALIVTPYVTTLPLCSPPLIHAELPLSDQQQQHIRTLLES